MWHFPQLFIIFSKVFSDYRIFLTSIVIINNVIDWIKVKSYSRSVNQKENDKNILVSLHNNLKLGKIVSRIMNSNKLLNQD